MVTFSAPDSKNPDILIVSPDLTSLSGLGYTKTGALGLAFL